MRYFVGVLAVLVGGCSTHAPVDLYAQDRPVLGYYAVVGNVEVEQCQVLLFHAIENRPPVTMASLLAEAREQVQAEGLVSITVDKKRTGWLLGHTECWTMGAQAVRYIRAER